MNEKTKRSYSVVLKRSSFYLRSAIKCADRIIDQVAEARFSAEEVSCGSGLYLEENRDFKVGEARRLVPISYLVF